MDNEQEIKDVEPETKDSKEEISQRKRKRKDLVEEVSALRAIKRGLNDKIKELQIKESNIEASMHTRQIEVESTNKLDKISLQRERNILIKEVNDMKTSLISRSQDLELKEQQFNDRIANLEKRELDIIDIDTKRTELQKQINDFHAYRRSVEQELELAKITIAEANAEKESIQIWKEQLDGREKAISAIEKQWNDSIGKLEADKKKFAEEMVYLQNLKQPTSEKVGKEKENGKETK